MSFVLFVFVYLLLLPSMCLVNKDVYIEASAAVNCPSSSCIAYIRDTVFTLASLITSIAQTYVNIMRVRSLALNNHCVRLLTVETLDFVLREN